MASRSERLFGGPPEGYYYVLEYLSHACVWQVTPLRIYPYQGTMNRAYLPPFRRTVFDPADMLNEEEVGRLAVLQTLEYDIAQPRPFLEGIGKRGSHPGYFYVVRS